MKVIKENDRGIKEITSHLFDIFEPRVRIFGNNRYIKYGELDKDNNVINPQILEIVDNILTIPCLFSSSANVLLVSEPSLSVPLVLTNNMVNVGETMSICEPWEEGYEYNKNILNQSLIDYSGGAIVYYNGDNWILKSYDMPGYMYSTKYKEMYFEGFRDCVLTMAEEEIMQNAKEIRASAVMNAVRWDLYEGVTDLQEIENRLTKEETEVEETEVEETSTSEDGDEVQEEVQEEVREEPQELSEEETEQEQPQEEPQEEEIPEEPAQEQSEDEASEDE